MFLGTAQTKQSGEDATGDRSVSHLLRLVEGQVLSGSETRANGCHGRHPNGVQLVIVHLLFTLVQGLVGKYMDIS